MTIRGAIKLKRDRKLVAFDMDGTLLEGNLIRDLAKNFDLTDELAAIQAETCLPGYKRTEKISSLLRGLNEIDIVETMSKMKLIKNWRSTMDELKSHNHVIGIISDSYMPACEYLRKKMNLDFSVANVLHVDENRFLTGEVSMPLGWEKIGCNCKISVCKRYQLERMAQKFHINLSNTVVVGDTASDLCMIERAGRGIAIMPKDDMIKAKSDIVVNSPDLGAIIPFVL